MNNKLAAFSFERLGSIAFLLLLTIEFCSCSSLRTPSPPHIGNDALSAYHDEHSHFRGAIHIHTSYSGNTEAPLDELRQALIRKEIDYAIITDHGTLKGRVLQGFHEKTLWVVGSEVATTAGQILTLGTNLDFSERQDPSVVLSVISQDGGLSFIAHPFGRKQKWTDWTNSSVTGMEIYNAADDLYDEWPVWLGIRWVVFPQYFFGRSTFDRSNSAIKQWDTLTKDRRVVAIGGSDAQARLKVSRFSFAGYEYMVGRVSTYALAKELTKEAVISALRIGHAYVAFDQWSDARSFMFHAINGNDHAIMGDEIRLTDRTEVRVWSPRKSLIRLIKDGNVWRQKKGQELRVSIDEPGVYRAELNLGRKLWIVSNPIYVKSSSRDGHPGRHLPGA